MSAVLDVGANINGAGGDLEDCADNPGAFMMAQAGGKPTQVPKKPPRPPGHSAILSAASLFLKSLRTRSLGMPFDTSRPRRCGVSIVSYRRKWSRSL